MARLPRPRVAPNQLPTQIAYIRDGSCAMANASRCYGTVADSTPDKSKGARASTPGLPYRPKPRQAKTSSPVERTVIRKADGTPFYVPSVRLSPKASKSPTVHKIHILGEDARSKFIAHALSGVYDSVERLAWKTTSRKYKYLQRLEQGSSKLEPLVVKPQRLAGKSNDHIGELIISSDTADSAMEALESVKHRINEESTVCLMNDGLGVLEDVRQKMFAVPEKRPTFLLGHMDHKFVYNRNFDSVRQLKSGQWHLTMQDQGGVMSMAQPKIETHTNFVKSLEAAKLLNTSYTPFDSWLRHKLPSMLFGTVVEPVCLMLDVPYSSLLHNRDARKLIRSLLEEVLLVVRHMPEIGHADSHLEILDIDKAQKALYKSIMRRQDRETELVRDVRLGRPLNIEYLNGYFLRRAHVAGLTLPTNRMLLDLVKAKQAVMREQAEAYIPVEETSIRPEMEMEYKHASRY